jgi:hypothetical protein
MKETQSKAAVIPDAQRKVGRIWLDIGVVLVTCALLFIGANWQLFTKSQSELFDPGVDVAKYQCYTIGFWHGMNAVKSTLSSYQCGFMDHTPVTNAQIAQYLQAKGLPQPLINFVKSQPVNSPLHVLPHEYPFLALLPYSLALIAPTSFFQVAFAVWMLILFAIMFIVLLRSRSRGAAYVFALFMVTGANVTGVARFDLIPAAATLFAVVCAMNKRWLWAYTFLALATLLKFYPGVLIIHFLIAQQQELGRGMSWLAWKRLRGFLLYVVLCAAGMLVSLLLSVEGTIGQFAYFGQRPMQVEALGASLMWIETSFTHSPMAYGYTFGSLNIVNHASLMSKVSILLDVMLLAGLLLTYWLQIRGKANLAVSSLLTLLVIIITGKVFSPQYLIWIAPLVAYIGGTDKRWVLSWSMIGILTSIIYPVIYNQLPITLVPTLPIFFPLTTLRNFILFGFVVAILFYCWRTKIATVVEPSQAAEAQPDVSVVH